MDCATAAGSSMEAGKASCERVLFAEKAQVMSLLNTMADPDSDVQGKQRGLLPVWSVVPVRSRGLPGNT